MDMRIIGRGEECFRILWRTYPAPGKESGSDVVICSKRFAYLWIDRVVKSGHRFAIVSKSLRAVSLTHMELEGENGIFMKIVRGEAPGTKVYEDDHTFAFLSNGPVEPGHTLVIPKTPFRNIFDIDQRSLAAVMETVRKVAPAVRDAVGAKGVQINSNHEPEAGQEVFHLHMHIIPRHDRQSFEFWPHGEYAPGEADGIAEKIRARLS